YRIVLSVVGFAQFIDYLIYGLLIPLTPYAPVRSASDKELGCPRLRSGSDNGERVCVGCVEQTELASGAAVGQRCLGRLYSHSGAAPLQERARMSQIIENPGGLLAALDRGESLPANWYTDPSITELETTRVFRKAWNYIGPLGELKHLGDYIAGYAGG